MKSETGTTKEGNMSKTEIVSEEKEVASDSNPTGQMEWKATQDSNGTDWRVRDVATNRLIARELTESCARLIASAPELLHIAKAMNVMGEHIDISQGIRLDRIFAANFTVLRAVISKAERRL